MNYPESLNSLIESLKKLPSIGEKSAERLAFAIMNMEEEEIEKFSQSIIDVKSKIKKCSICGNITEEETCFICNDNNRDKKTLCVVKDSKDIISIEKTGSFCGKYHVLNGLISPSEGKGPEDISINKLLKRIKEENIQEIIMAINSTLDGETTALYISKILEKESVIVTKIARGIPVGADMEYLDSMTLSMALINRDKIS
jgi:recombination protein RecR